MEQWLLTQRQPPGDIPGEVSKSSTLEKVSTLEVIRMSTILILGSILDYMEPFNGYVFINGSWLIMGQLDVQFTLSFSRLLSANLLCIL